MRRKFIIVLLVALIAATSGLCSSCGSTRSYWGIESEYDPGYNHGYDKGHKKHKKHKKPKKHDKHHGHHYTRCYFHNRTDIYDD